MERTCSRTACPRPAVATLTFVYADSTAVLGPLARAVEPHSYDLCRDHAKALTVPRGWHIMRIGDLDVPHRDASEKDMFALADALEALNNDEFGAQESHAAPAPVTHLRVLREE